MSILIKDTTPMERIAIVKEALGGEYDEFYDDYVSGSKETVQPLKWFFTFSGGLASRF